MLNTVYRLVSPRQIEAEFKDVDVNGDNIIVRPTHLSICMLTKDTSKEVGLLKY